MKSFNHQADSIELLRQRIPEYMPTHRVAVLKQAIENLRPHAPIEAEVVVPQSQEVINHQVQTEGPSVIAAAERLTQMAAQEVEIAREEIDGLVDVAKSYASGEGNPFFDEALNA